MKLHAINSTFALALGAALAGCFGPSLYEETSATETAGDGDGDPGDGDGDPGDGDGDPGDGDPGDGDGDPGECADDPGAQGCPCSDNATCNDGLLCVEMQCHPNPFDKGGTFTRVDRAGMPAINTAVITSKDAYNAADPIDDVANTFVGEITDRVGALHMALDDDLVGVGLTPCGLFDCVSQAGPLIIPDTLKLDYESPAGFPNGRELENPVIDVTLAVILLDLSVMGQDPATLVDILNPAYNDVAFDDEFPYLAAPN